MNVHNSFARLFNTFWQKETFSHKSIILPFFSPLFTLRKLIYIPQNRETHHIYKISIPKISKHIFIPVKISPFRTAKMGCLSAPHFSYFPLFKGILPLLLPLRYASASNYILWYSRRFSLHLYNISCEQSDCFNMG